MIKAIGVDSVRWTEDEMLVASIQLKTETGLLTAAVRLKVADHPKLQALSQQTVDAVEELVKAELEGRREHRVELVKPS